MIPSMSPLAGPEAPPAPEPSEADRGAQRPLSHFSVLDPVQEAPRPPVVGSVLVEETVTATAVVTAGEAFAAKSAQAEARATALIEQLGRHIRPGMDPEIQKEAAELISLISDLAYEEFTEFFPLVTVAVAAVVADPPNLILASRIRKSIRRRTNLLLRPLLFLRNGHPAVQVILGLCTNLYLLLPFSLLLLPGAVQGSAFPGTSDETFVLVAVAGAVGSIVSMLVRIQDFDNQEVEHRAILFFTGCFKPAIGVASALFIAVLMEAGFIPIDIEEGAQRTFFFLGLAFVAGFSERLASDIAGQAEGRLKGPRKG